MKLSEIARRIDCRMVGNHDVEIARVAGIDEAGPGDLTFVSNRKYISHIKSTQASAIILGEDIPGSASQALGLRIPILLLLVRSKSSSSRPVPIWEYIRRLALPMM